MKNQLKKVFDDYTLLSYKGKKDLVVRGYASLWGEVQELRKQKSFEVPLVDQSGNKFWFFEPPFLKERLLRMDNVGKSELEKIVSKEIQHKVIMNSILDEAFYSSVVEGAFSTKKRTREVIESKNPKDKSEQMIFNNHNGLMFVLENLDRDLNEETLLRIYKIITDNTLEPDEIVDKYRNDFVYVWSDNAVKQEPIYTAPKHEDVQWMMDDLFKFINDDKIFIHPVIKASIIHFYLVYVHPFFDGNGRVARAFTYMYLLKNGYDFFKFFSISSVVNEKRNRYYKGIKDTEDYDGDLMYFIDTYTEITVYAMHEVIQKMRHEHDSRLLFSLLEADGILLNQRQIKAITKLSKGDGNLFDIAKYRKITKSSYETARTDINLLKDLGIVKQLQKKGNKYLFRYVGHQGYME